MWKACRGAKLDAGVDVTDTPGDRKKEVVQVIRIPIEADFLYMYSSAPGECIKGAAKEISQHLKCDLCSNEYSLH